MDPRQQPRQRHHHPFQDKHDVPAWARTLNDNLQVIWWVLELVMEKLDMTKEEIVATLTATNDVLTGVLERLDTLDGDSTSVTDELAKLRKQIEDGQIPDLSGIEAAAAKIAETAASLRAKAGEAPPAPAPEQQPESAPEA